MRGCADGAARWRSSRSSPTEAGFGLGLGSRGAGRGHPLRPSHLVLGLGGHRVSGGRPAAASQEDMGLARLADPTRWAGLARLCPLREQVGESPTSDDGVTGRLACGVTCRCAAATTARSHRQSVADDNRTPLVIAAGARAVGRPRRASARRTRSMALNRRQEEASGRSSTLPRVRPYRMGPGGLLSSYRADVQHATEGISSRCRVSDLWWSAPLNSYWLSWSA